MFGILVFTILLMLLGLLLLLSLTLSVEALLSKHKSLKTASLITFLCFAFLCGSTSGYAGRKAVDIAYTIARTFSNGVKTVANGLFLEGVSIMWTDDRTYLLNKASNPQILLLQSYVPNEVLSTINPQYYTYFGFRDWWRFPLVWPYSVHTTDVIDDGCLYDESPVSDYAGGINYADNLQICGITHIALDKHYLLMRTQVHLVNQRRVSYVIFNFDAREKTLFDSEEEMFGRAKELDFKGTVELLTLKQYDALFRR